MANVWQSIDKDYDKDYDEVYDQIYDEVHHWSLEVGGEELTRPRGAIKIRVACHLTPKATRIGTAHGIQNA